MGCNTSQELKTKDGATALNGEVEAADASVTNNGDAKGITVNGGEHEQNDNNYATEEAQKAVVECSKSAKNHTNHSKSNSITSSGDGGDAKKHLKDGNLVESSSASKARKGSPQVNGHASKWDEKGSASARSSSSSSSAAAGGERGNQRQCDKAEISELNDDDDEEMDGDEAKAATKIQAAFRGHKVRSTMKKSETKTTGNSNNNAAGNAAGAGAAAASIAPSSNEATKDEPTKSELEAEFDPNDKELCEAASKIQATFRGHLARKLVNKDEPEDVDIQEITKKVAEELDIDLTDPELNKAATKIQASFRGHKIRKDVATVAE